MYTFSLYFFTGSNTIESSSKSLTQSPVKNLPWDCSFIKKRLRRSCLPVIFAKLFRTSVLRNKSSHASSSSCFTVAFFFWISDLVFRFNFYRNMYIFTIFFTGPNTIESSSKLFKQSPVKHLLWACNLIKKRLRHSCFPVIFVINSCFKEHILAHQLIK